MNAGYMSGRQLKNFRKGWAVRLFSFGKGHYWNRLDFEMAQSICGEIGLIRWLYGVGNWPLCKKCLRVKQGKKAA